MNFQGIESSSSSIVRRCVPQSASKCGTGCGTEAMARLTERAVQTAKTGTAWRRRRPVSRRQRDGTQEVGSALPGRARRDKGLGSYPDSRPQGSPVAGPVAEPEAHRQGRRPHRGSGRAARKAAKPVPTFGDIAQLVIADAQSKSINAKVRYQWERHLGPAIPAPCWIGRARDHHLDVAAVLRPVWRTKPEVARKLYPAIRRVFERARILLRDEHGISDARQSRPVGRSEGDGL